MLYNSSFYLKKPHKVSCELSPRCKLRRAAIRTCDNSTSAAHFTNNNFVKNHVNFISFDTSYTKHTRKRARARGVPEDSLRYRAHAALVAFVSKHASSPCLEAVRMAATSLSRNSTSDGRLSNLSCSWKSHSATQNKTKRTRAEKPGGGRRSEAGLCE